MKDMTDEIADLVIEFGGGMSGEHGDGLARSHLNEKLFGPQLYKAFRQVKARIRSRQSDEPRQNRQCSADDGEPALRDEVPHYRDQHALRFHS